MSLPVIVPATSADSDLTKLIGWLQEGRHEWNGLLLTAGKMLFRGFNVTSVAEFERILRAISQRPINYIGGNSPRTQVTGKVYTSTEYPADQIISLHNELSYAQSWPMHILFWCEIPATHGGETPTIDSRAALHLLPAALVERFENKGLIYLQTLHGGRGLGRSWQSTFETTERSTVEEILSSNGTRFEWTESGGIRIQYNRKAIEIHPTTGERVWFSQADQWHPSNLGAKMRSIMEQLLKVDEFPHNVNFGDGSSINEEDLSTIRNTLWESAIVIPWQRGDILLLDNMLTAHGRRSFKGKRKVYVSMAC